MGRGVSLRKENIIVVVLGVEYEEEKEVRLADAGKFKS